MITLTVFLARAVLCINMTCFPVLVGDTVIGTFVLKETRVTDPSYGGSVLVFAEAGNRVWSIHRVWQGRPIENRLERLYYGKAKDRHITKGCINVTDEMYVWLATYCGARQCTLHVKE